MKKIFLITVTALALAACDKNSEEPAISSVPAQITATIGDNGRSRAVDNTWNAGDKIGITTTFQSKVGPFINMEYATENGDGVFKGTTIYIYNPMSLTAYYPFDGSETTAPGQDGIISASTTSDFQASDKQPHIDFLFATKEGITTDNTNVALDFAHKMSKLTFIFKAGDGADVSKIKSYKIDGLIMGGTFNTATGVCEAKGEASPLEIGVTDVKNEVAVPPLILFPQSTTEVKLTITDTDNQVYACDLNFTDNKIEEGNNYLYTITVNKTGLTVNASTIADWNTEPLGSSAGSVLE